MEIQVDWNKPSYFHLYETRLHNWHFNGSCVQIRLPVSVLDTPLLTGEKGAAKLAISQMERKRQQQRRPRENHTIQQVRASLVPEERGFPSLPQVAACLHMSARTLKRQLNDAGTHFQALLDEEKMHYAVELMRQPGTSLQDIGHALGYADAAAFTRAFKR
jgi:AraC-like DNA-binding protein